MMALLAAYVLYMGIIVVAGFAVRDFALSRITTIFTANQATISVAPLEKEKAAEAVRIATGDASVKSSLAARASHQLLLYVVPHEWNIPELGLEGMAHAHNVLSHPGSHGNPPGFNHDSLIVLVTEPILASSEAGGKALVKNSLSFNPILEVLVDMKQNRIINKKTTRIKNARGKCRY
jgi:hypothetical protein